MQPEFTAAQARAEDVPGMVTVFQENSHDWTLLPKTADDIRATMAGFVVVKNQAGEVLGCAALYADSLTLAEVGSVGVRPQSQGKGVGALLMNQCEEVARTRGLKQLWLATMKPQYFARFGYRPISKWKLPLKVLFRKLGQVLKLPLGMWWRELTAPFTFMQKELE